MRGSHLPHSSTSTRVSRKGRLSLQGTSHPRHHHALLVAMQCKSSLLSQIPPPSATRDVTAVGAGGRPVPRLTAQRRTFSLFSVGEKGIGPSNVKARAADLDWHARPKVAGMSGPSNHLHRQVPAAPASILPGPGPDRHFARIRKAANERLMADRENRMPCCWRQLSHP